MTYEDIAIAAVTLAMFVAIYALIELGVEGDKSARTASANLNSAERVVQRNREYYAIILSNSLTRHAVQRRGKDGRFV